MMEDREHPSHATNGHINKISLSFLLRIRNTTGCQFRYIQLDDALPILSAELYCVLKHEVADVDNSRCDESYLPIDDLDPAILPHHVARVEVPVTESERSARRCRDVIFK